MKSNIILSGLTLSAVLLAGCCTTEHAQTPPPISIAQALKPMR